MQKEWRTVRDRDNSGKSDASDGKQQRHVANAVNGLASSVENTPTPSRDDLAAAIATIKQVTRASAESCEGDTWTATDISQPYEPCEVDAAIAKILNAVVSGELVSRARLDQPAGEV